MHDTPDPACPTQVPGATRPNPRKGGIVMEATHWAGPPSQASRGLLLTDLRSHTEAAPTTAD